MKKTCLATLLFLLVAMMLLTPVQTVAQAVYGSIFGNVTDPQGAAVPNAKVTVTDMDKGTTQDATTNESGNFNVTHLIPGRYRVRVQASGFKAYEATDLQVFADQSIRVNAQFQMGGTQETVTVTAEDVPLVKTDRADVATTFTAKQVTELPLSINRNFTELQLATPGTQTLSWQHAASENPQQSTQIMVNGQHFSGTSYQLDGTDNRDPILGIIVINPNLEAVTEAKIATQNYDAEFGQAVAAVITAQTKSGSNDVHGSGFWFRRNDQMSAKDPFQGADPITGRVLPDALWNQFGGGMGGPIIKDKWFVFGDFQGTRQKVGRAVRVTVPTQLVRDTCLNPASDVCNFSEYLPVQLFNPNTGDVDPETGLLTGTGRDPIAGNIFSKTDIPLSAPAVAMLSVLPTPNGPGFRDNYTGTGTGGFDANSFDVRSDYTLSDSVHVFGRYSYARYDLNGRSVFDTDDLALGGRGLGLNGFGAQSKTRNHSVAAGFDWALSTDLLTDFRFGWFKYRVNVLPNGLGTSPATDFGVPGLNLDDFYTSGMPAFFINGGGNTGDMEFGYGLSDRLNRCNCPLDQNEDQFQFVNNWTRIQNNHQFKFGADIRYARNLRVPSDAHRAGELSFTNGGTGAPESETPSGIALASFMLGRVQRFERYVSSATDAGERQKRWYFYGQDTWRVTPKLTLNYGLRWEIYFPQTVTGEGKGGWPDLSSGRMLIAGLGGVDLAGNVENSYKNFAPRLGVSYQATDKTVVRLGYGRSFDIGVFGSTFGHTVTQNLPVLARQSNVAGSDLLTTFQLENGPPAFVFPEPGPDGTIGFEQLRGVTIRVPNRKMQLPTIDAWNLTIQRAITPTMSGEIAYVGNKGTHAFVGNGPDLNRNQASLEGWFPGRPTNEFRPYAQLYGWTQDITTYFNEASNNYHALQMKLDKRFSQGWSLNAHYTWSKAFNYGNDYYPIDPDVSYGRFDFNRDHVFVLTNLLELPFGRGKALASGASGILQHIIGGWQVNNVLNISSGLPWTPSYASCSQDQDVNVCRPNLVGEFNLSDGEFVPNTPGQPGGTVRGLFEGVPTLATNGASAGPWERPAAGTLGNMRRNSLTGPNFWNMDASLFKNFRFNERINAQLRLEAFNVFNHRNNGTPSVFWTAFGGGGNQCIDCDDSGVIRGLSSPMRQMQVGLKVSF